MIICLDIAAVKRNSGFVEFNSNMPTKKPSLFEVSGKEPAKPKAPTLKQFIKQNPDVEYPVYSRIEIVWFPGTWDNYSLETPMFRCSVGSNHPIYSALDNSIVKVLSETQTALLIELTDSDGTIRIAESNVFGQYVAIGNAGYKFELTHGAN